MKAGQIIRSTITNRIYEVINDSPFGRCVETRRLVCLSWIKESGQYLLLRDVKKEKA